MESSIPLSIPNLCSNEQKYVQEAMGAGWISTGGAFVTRFEQNVAAYVGAADAVACQSGTAGLHLALLASGVGPKDLVVVPTLTFIAAVNPVKYVGADPVFMDCDDTLCMDMDKLEEFLSQECRQHKTELIHKSGRRVKAVLVVHVFGNMACMSRLMDLSNRYGFAVIEDATEALGTYVTEGPYKGRHAGTIAPIGVFSFNANKIITTGGGGMIVAHDRGTLERLRYLSTQAKDDELYFRHDAIGYNYRLTNVQAAIGVAQMEMLEAFIQTKAHNYGLYQSTGVPLLPFRRDIRPNFWFYSYLSDKRDQLIEFLGVHHVQTRPVWHLIHTQKPYLDAMAYRIEKAVYYWEKIVNLPCSSSLSRDQVLRVCDLIKQFCTAEGVEA